MGMTLLPPAPGTCPVCATPHEPAFPHNQQSVYYQYRFFGVHKRWPTWADAVAHCSEVMKAAWFGYLASYEHIAPASLRPSDGVEPIAEPPDDFTAAVIDMGIEPQVFKMIEAEPEEEE